MTARRLLGALVALAVLTTGAITPIALDSDRANAAEPEIGPPPTAECASTAVSPYPPVHVFCLRKSPHAELTASTAAAGNGDEVTFTVTLNSPECPASIAQRVYPCVESIKWDWGQTSGLPYRLVTQAGTYFKDQFSYYQPFTFANVPESGCIFGSPNPSDSPSCRRRIQHVPGVGPMPPAYVVMMPAIEVAFGPSQFQIEYIETSFRLLVEPPDTRPIAAFAATEIGVGKWAFDGTASTDPDGDGIAWVWDFGDGHDGDGPLVNHQYEKPGTYGVTLTVTDADGNADTVTKQVHVAAPSLHVNMALLGGSNFFEPGARDTLRLTVSMDDDGVGDLTQVAFVGEPLDISALPGVFETTGGPLPTIPDPGAFTLTTGARSRSFDFPVAANAPGAFSVSSTWKAVDAAGNELAPVTGTLDGRVGALHVDVTIEPDDVTLDETDSGPIPQDVGMTITVTNPLQSPVTNAKLEFLPEIVVTSGARDPNQFPAVWLRGEDVLAEGRPDPVDLGTIPAGGSVAHTLEVRAKDDGAVDFKVLVTAAAGDGPLSSTIFGAGTGRLRVNQPVAFYFEATRDPVAMRNGEPWVIGGDLWTIHGFFENRTADKDVIVQLIPKNTGNAMGGVPMPSDVTIPEPECAMGIVRRVKPGEKVFYTAMVKTLYDGATRSTVEYEPKAWIVEDDGRETPLTDAQVRVKEGSLHHEVHVDTSVPPPPPLTIGEGFWIFTDNAIQGFGTLAEGIASLLNMAYEIAKLNLEPWRWPGKLDSALVGFADYTRRTYEALSPDEKEQWDNSVTFALMDLARISFAEAHALVDTAIQGMFQPITTAWETSDSRSLVAALGRFSGENADSVFESLAAGYGVCKLLRKGSQFLRSLGTAAVEQIAELPARLRARGIRGFLGADPIDIFDAIRFFGVHADPYRALQQLAKDWDLVAVVRRRSPGSIRRLEEGALPKMEKVKAKNVTAIDSDYLEFPPNELDHVVIMEPPPWEEVLAKLGGRDDEFVTEVHERWLRRWEEFHGKGDGNLSELEQMRKYADEGGVPVPTNEVGLNPLENGIEGVERSAVWERRPMRLREIEAPNGRKAYRVEVAAPRTTTDFRPLTGDIDPVAFLNREGKPLPPNVRKELYKTLREMGFQHPETMTLTNEQLRSELLRKHLVDNPDREPLMAFYPDGDVRAVFLDANKSWVDPNDLNHAFIYLQGGKVVYNAKDAQAGPTPAVADDQENVYIGPGTWTLLDEHCPANGPGPQGRARFLLAGATCPANVRFTNGPEGVVVRQPEAGAFERWTPATGWRPYDVGNGAVERLDVLPQTALAAAVPAGATEIPIAELAELGIDGDNAFFEIGQRIVLDPGGPNEEFATITAFGSLILAAPLAHAHGAGEMVTVVEGTAPAASAGMTTTTTLASPATTSTSPGLVVVTTGTPSAAPSTVTGSLPFTGGGNRAALGWLLLALGIVFVAGGRVRRQRAAR